MGRPTIPTADAIRESIRRLLGPGGVRITDVAADLHTSRSQIQRAMAAAETSFTAELREARLESAMRLLLKDGKSVKETAERVGVSPDYLRELVFRVWGVTPGRVRRSIRHVKTLRRWRRTIPPAYGTKLYWQRRRQHSRLERDLHRMLDPIPHHSPIRSWANDVLAYAKRPDLRRQPHHDRVRRARAEERRARAEEHRTMMEHFAALFGDTPRRPRRENRHEA